MKKQALLSVALFFLVGGLFLTGCGGDDDMEMDDVVVDTTGIMDQENTMATVMLQPTEGNNVTGNLQFNREGDGVRVTGTITGLGGSGEHGMHVHEFGDCSAPDASSAGGHFNPTGSPHGGPDQPPAQRHVGDFGNITADASGNVNVDLMLDGLTLEGPNGIVGKAVVVHAGRDDLQSQPAGDSGARVACGVISMDGAAGMNMPQDTLHSM